MFRIAFVIAVVDTFHCFAVNTDGPAGMCQRTRKHIVSLSLLCKALTAGLLTVAGMLAAHHDISLGTEAVLVVGTIFHYTL